MQNLVVDFCTPGSPSPGAEQITMVLMYVSSVAEVVIGPDVAGFKCNGGHHLRT